MTIRRIFHHFSTEQQYYPSSMIVVVAQQIQTRMMTSSTTTTTTAIEKGLQQQQQHNNNNNHKKGYQSIGSFHSENIYQLLMMSDDEYIPPTTTTAMEHIKSDVVDNLIVRSSTITTIEEFDSNTDIHRNNNIYRNDFLLDLSKWTFLNHGAFGATLKVGHNQSNYFRNTIQEQQPLQYYDRILLPHLVYTIRLLCTFLNVPHRDHVTLLPNVTTGLNTLFAGHVRCCIQNNSQPNVIIWDTTYGSVKKMVQHYYNENYHNNNNNHPNSRQSSIKSKDNVIEIPFQEKYFSQLASSNDPEEVFITAIDDCINTILASSSLSSSPTDTKKQHYCFVLDHITSNTALTMPITRLTHHIKQRMGQENCIVIVDGAHGLFNYDINLSNILLQDNTDVYVLNGHKWFCTPKGVAIMIVHPINIMNHPIFQHIVQRPNIISHGVNEIDLVSRYIWDGCRDYNAALGVPAVLQYWKSNENMHQLRVQCRTTLLQGIEILVQTWYSKDIAMDHTMWSTKYGITLAKIDSSVLSSLMILIRLPPISLHLLFDDDDDNDDDDTLTINENKKDIMDKNSFGVDVYDNDPIQYATSDHAKMVQDYLHYHHSIEVPIKCINHQLYVRLSCHIYNTIEDFTILAQCIHTIQNKLIGKMQVIYE